MSGLASLLFATALTFGWVKPEVANNPNAWWSIAGTCLLYAVFASWQDEHHLVETLRAENTAPRLILKYMTDIHRYWQIANTGDDAFNVTSEPIIGASIPQPFLTFPTFLVKVKREHNLYFGLLTIQR
jgi:hypothetical protein